MKTKNDQYNSVQYKYLKIYIQTRRNMENELKRRLNNASYVHHNKQIAEKTKVTRNVK